MPRISGDVAARILTAGVTLLAAEGPRAIKSSAVAAAAGTSESSLFRHYQDMPDLLSDIYDSCWGRINDVVNDPANPLWGTPGDLVAGTFQRVWDLALDEASTDVLFIAFTYYRRPQALGGRKVSVNQARFEQGLTKLCAAHLAAPDERAAQALQMTLTNFASTVILSWIFDSPEVPQLTRDEAAVGVRSLLEGFHLNGPGKRMAERMTGNTV